MNNYTFEISYQGNDKKIIPYGTLNISTKKEDKSRYYKKTLSNFSVKNKDDYDFILNIKNSNDLCSPITLKVYKKCNGLQVLKFDGLFSISDCEFDENNCIIEIKPQLNDLYSCINKNGNKDINLLDIDNHVYNNNVDIPSPSGWVNNVFIYNAFGIENELRVLRGEQPPTPEKLHSYVGNEYEYQYIKIQQIFTGTSGQELPESTVANKYDHYIAWQYRKVIPKLNGQCQNELSGDYTLVDSTSIPSSCIYMKKPADNDSLFINADFCDSIGARTEIIYDNIWSDESSVTRSLCVDYVAKNRRQLATSKLDNFILKLIPNCDLLGIKSNFFSINPDNGDDPFLDTIDYVTGLTSQINNLNISHKSDVVNWNIGEIATIGNLSWNSFIEDFTNIFNLGWTIQDGYLRIEHVSYFEDFTIINDFTIGKYKKFINGNKKYRYEKAQLPFIELVEQSEYQSSDFEKSQIIYEDSNGDKLDCVGDEEVNHSFGLFFTDLQYYSEKPQDVNLNGWVLISAERVSNEIRSEVGLKTGVNNLNGHLATSNLTNTYYLSDMSANIGTIDGVDKIFSSSKKIKTSDEIMIIECCDDEIKTDELIKDFIGDGEIVETNKNLKTDELTIKLKY